MSVHCSSPVVHSSSPVQCLYLPRQQQLLQGETWQPATSVTFQVSGLLSYKSKQKLLAHPAEIQLFQHAEKCNCVVYLL